MDYFESVILNRYIYMGYKAIYYTQFHLVNVMFFLQLGLAGLSQRDG